MNLVKGMLVVFTFFFALFFAFCAVTLAEGQNVKTGEAVLRAMHDRYQSSWYQTLTFTQKSTTYKPDGTSSAETWYEAAMLPGKLRIDIGPQPDGNGYVFSDGSITILQNNKIVATKPSINMLLVLGFDVYRQDPETTIKVVKGESYDLTKFREDTWQGHPAYVVGAARATSSPSSSGLRRTRCSLCARSSPRGTIRKSSTTSGSPAITRWLARGWQPGWKSIPTTSWFLARTIPISRLT
jgi:hypothetical protein